MLNCDSGEVRGCKGVCSCRGEKRFVPRCTSAKWSVFKLDLILPGVRRNGRMKKSFEIFKFETMVMFGSD